MSTAHLAHLLLAPAFRTSPLWVQKNSGNDSVKQEVLYVLVQSPMATEDRKPASLPRKAWRNKPASITSSPSTFRGSAVHGRRPLQSPEWRRGRSSTQITNQSTQRLFKWLKTPLSCFLLRVSLPSPAFKCTWAPLQTKITRALRSFKQSKLWSLRGCHVDGWMVLPGLGKTNIRCALGS